MNVSGLDRIIPAAVILAVLAATSCGGGSQTTAGAGGSGIGGTGVTLVRGNVATVVAAVESRRHDPIVAMLRLLETASRPALAAEAVRDIRVSGGGKSDVTDEQGRFELIDVTPSANFMLVLALSDGKQIKLAIGPVRQNEAVQVNNVVVDARKESATFSNVEVEDNSAELEGIGSDDDDSDDDSADGGEADDDSADSDDGEDGDSSG